MLWSRLALAALLLLASTARVLAEAPPPLRRAATLFGQALTSGDASSLRPVLPAGGKVRLHLLRLGPEDGSFSPGQVEAVLGDFLSRGSVQAFELIRIESDETFALVHGRALLTDARGRRARVALHLSLRPENGRWVVREIREPGP